MWPLFVAAGIGLAPAVLACFVKNKIGKAILSVISIGGFFICTVLLAAFALPSYFGVHRTWLPFVVCGALFVILMLFAWKPFDTKKRRIAAATIAGVTIIITGVFTTPPIYKNSLVVKSGEEVYLGEYAPFGEYYYNDARVLTHRETKAALLNEEATLKLYGNLPVLDGATALYPLYSAYVRATYPAPESSLDIPEYNNQYADLRDADSKALIVCSRTSAAFENLIDGYADIVFLMGVSDEQRVAAEAKDLELTLTPIGREAFVFFVNSRNSISDVSSDNIKRIYSGEVTNWSEVGGKNNVIRAYQRPETSGSQVQLRQIMGSTPIAPAPEEDVFDMMMGMVRRVANYSNYKNSLGYSFLYYARDMVKEHNIKFLSIDGISPTSENIASEAYPFANDFYAVTVKSNGVYLNPERAENINRFLEWMEGSQGKYLVEATGYIPIK